MNSYEKMSNKGLVRPLFDQNDRPDLEIYVQRLTHSRVTQSKFWFQCGPWPWGVSGGDRHPDDLLSVLN